MTEARVRAGNISGSALVPGSKSIAQRALILATRNGGTVRNVPQNDDLERLLAGLRGLGFRVEERGSEVAVGGGFAASDARLDLGDNGTGARCLMALAALREATTVIDGSARLRERPMAPLCAALRALGATVEGDALPVAVRGPLRGGEVRVSTDLSSQYATALILIVDRVKGMKIKVEGKNSFSYVSLTSHLLRRFRDPFFVEPDFSSAGALAVAAATTGGDLLLSGLGLSSAQPDARIVPMLNRAGARVTGVEGGIRVQGGKLRGIRVNLANSPDIAPLLAVLGALAEGETLVEGAPHLAHKESNRIATTCAMIRAVGGRADPLPDGFRVFGGHRLLPARIPAAGDHRIAMAAGVLALSVPGVTVDGSEAVAKSWPGFFRELDRLTAP